MSRTSSGASGSTQVATGASSTIYTALLLVALVSLIAAGIVGGMVLNSNYGYVMPIGESFDKAERQRETMLSENQQDIETIEQALNAAVLTDAGARSGSLTDVEQQ